MRDFIARLCCFLAATTLAILPCLSAPPHLSVVARKNAGGGAPPSYLFGPTDFEDTGTPSGWTNGVGSPNYDYSASPLAGSESLRMTGLADTADYRGDVILTGQSEMEVYALVKFEDVASTGNNYGFIGILSSASTSCCYARISSSSMYWQIDAMDSHVTTSTTAMSLGTTYHVWLRYVPGSGSNGYASLAWSTDGTRPTSGPNFIEVTNGSRTANPERVWFYGQYVSSSNAADVVFDNVIIHNGTIGNQ